MKFSELNTTLRDAILESDYHTIPDLFISWVDEYVSDIELQNEALGHAADCRKILKKIRQNRLTREEGDVEFANWRLNFLSFLQTLRQYSEEQEQKRTAQNNQPELIRKVRHALEDLNYKKEIRLFRRFQLTAKQNRGVFLISGAQYYGQHWLYQLLLKLLSRSTQNEPVRQVPLDFSGPVPLDLFIMELQDEFGLIGSGSESDDLTELIDQILKIWESDQSIIFRLEMNGNIPVQAMDNFLKKFWIPLFQASQQRSSSNYLLLFLIFGQPFSLPEELPAPRPIVYSRALTDQWIPVHPLLLDIQMLDLALVVDWLDSRMLQFDDLSDPEVVARELMKNQDLIHPEMVMMGFCRRYQLSFRNHILTKL